MALALGVLKGSGMFWREPGAKNLINIRTAFLTQNRISDFWDRRVGASSGAKLLFLSRSPEAVSVISRVASPGVLDLVQVVTSSFLEKLLARLDRVSPDHVQPILLRLIREKGFLEKVFEALQEGVIVLDPQGGVTFLNRAAARFFGVEVAESVGKPLGVAIPGLEWSALADETRRGPASRDFEVFYPENRMLNLYAAPITDEGEDPGTEDDQQLGTVLLIRDVTQTHRLTEEKIESERLNALTMLAAGVAHELGNPLNSLNIHLQLLDRKLKRQSAEAHAAVSKQLDVARGEIQRLDFIISQFLQAIRPSRPQLELEDINSLLGEAIRFLEPEILDRQIQLGLTLANDLPLRRVDGGQMKQAFYNIIRNACQATPPGGSLTIVTEADELEMRLSFADSGVGISAEQLGHMFEAFATTKKGGTGLGLLIVRRIVREHGGEIEIRSGGGNRGTTIVLHFPHGPRLPRLLPG